MRKIIGIAAGAAILGTIGIAAPAAQAAATPCSAQAKACLRLSTHQAWLTNNGQVTRGPVPVTVGKAGHETPTGRFRVQYRDADHYSKEFDARMPYSVFFTTTGVAFHEGSLREQSHGCVHLSHSDAVAFYQTLRTGDVVEVVN
ncbi:L,D-transpeptidase [Amycolatopsis thermophila]|uniref:Lipoprotein-anchoring transpeptidase ErfK/SrfK n=1 Tax=Amycolatopsis thermophila TaxID=206084 RepID=A0ABU0ESX3_9PSEU|nr:L,D-transpeptidase [Amycolatopsis thermophila]MDQ0378408.1 lipoprotein-anchoring transpeptidase ErfK/SrfK [Amycolatopsis thermophila]